MTDSTRTTSPAPTAPASRTISPTGGHNAVSRRSFLSLAAASVALAGLGLAGCGSSAPDAAATSGSAQAGGPIQITNVSYDPTRELYEAYNKIFAKHWAESHDDQDVQVTQSHGGSGKQALEVANGLAADVVTLALEADIDSLVDAGLIQDGWVSEFPKDSSPYTSTIDFLVRKGNPKGIKDWDDLVKEGVGVITPNPKTSGGARWNYLAAWAYAKKQFGGDEGQIKDFVAKLYKNVLVLDSGARGATTTFVENGQGDVLIAWENEAYLSVKDHPDDFEIVTPSLSILAQPSVAVVDAVVDERGTREVATEYLNYLYSEEAQRNAGENFYRPSDENVLKEFSDKFEDLELVTIQDFGGWKDAQETHFADGGVFDQIYGG